MRIDLHCHSRFSPDSFLEPEDLIKAAIEKDLDGVCFTEHYSLDASLSVEKIQIPEGFLVLRGLEASTDLGHLLIYGLKDDSWNIWSRHNYLDSLQVIERIHELGGICAPAHAFRGFESFGEEVMRIDGLDAIETHNGLNPQKANQEAIKAAQLRNLPSIGGSDCHQEVQVGRAYTVFESPVYTIEDVVREIKLGRCRGARHSED